VCDEWARAVNDPRNKLAHNQREYCCRPRRYGCPARINAPIAPRKEEQRNEDPNEQNLGDPLICEQRVLDRVMLEHKVVQRVHQ
jgi:hypothetical protein